MNLNGVYEELSALTSFDDIEFESAHLVNLWRTRGVGVEAVEPVLRFMESHPEVDFGVPGEFVHFMEDFYEKGYEEQLLKSLNRRSTPHTIWMLNRLINGVTDQKQNDKLSKTLLEIPLYPLATNGTREAEKSFVS